MKKFMTFLLTFALCMGLAVPAAAGAFEMEDMETGVVLKASEESTGSYTTAYDNGVRVKEVTAYVFPAGTEFTVEEGSYIMNVDGEMEYSADSCVLPASDDVFVITVFRNFDFSSVDFYVTSSGGAAEPEEPAEPEQPEEPAEPEETVPAAPASSGTVTLTNEQGHTITVEGVVTENAAIEICGNDSYTANGTLIELKPGSMISVENAYGADGKYFWCWSYEWVEKYQAYEITLDSEGSGFRAGTAESAFELYPLHQMFDVTTNTDVFLMLGKGESEPAPVEPTPVEPAPVEPAPVEPAPVEPAPVEPAPVEPAPVEPAPVEPAPVEPAPVEPAPIEPTPADPAAYTVKAGDTMGQLALNYYGSYKYHTLLTKANADVLAKNGYKLNVGMSLTLPEKLGEAERLEPQSAAEGETLYTVKSGDTLGAIAKEVYGDVMQYKAIYERNSDRLVSADCIYEGQIIVLPAK